MHQSSSSLSKDLNLLYKEIANFVRIIGLLPEGEQRKNCGSHHSQVEIYTGCPTKNYTVFWRAVAPLYFELGIKVGGVLEFSGSQL